MRTFTPSPIDRRLQEIDTESARWHLARRHYLDLFSNPQYKVIPERVDWELYQEKLRDPENRDVNLRIDGTVTYYRGSVTLPGHIVIPGVSYRRKLEAEEPSRLYVEVLRPGDRLDCPLAYRGFVRDHS